jgi:hypothetical protein
MAARGADALIGGNSMRADKTWILMIAAALGFFAQTAVANSEAEDTMSPARHAFFSPAGPASSAICSSEQGGCVTRAAGDGGCPFDHSEPVPGTENSNNVQCRCKEREGYYLVGNACRLATWQTMHIQAKSYIARVDLTNLKQFDPGLRMCTEIFMSAVVTCGTHLGENPADGTKASGNYRLWSNLTADIGCVDNKVAAWNFKPVETDFGKEFWVISTSGDLEPLQVSPSASGKKANDRITFSYRMRGQPNEKANATMRAVKPRTCTFIWHEVSGSVVCQSNKATVEVNLRGSAFPSHRLWLQGGKVTEIAQGPFSKLWECDPKDPTSVQ